MSDHSAAILFAVSAVLDVALTGFVWSRRQGNEGRALGVMLLALMVWNVAYAGELLSGSLTARVHWGDLKYVGIGALAPAWVAFILYWTGQGHRVTHRLLGALAIEPVLVLVLLAIPSSHDLIRHLPENAGAAGTQFVVASGPLFWVHLFYSDVLMLGAAAVFIRFLLRKSHGYRTQVAVLVAAALLPWVGNLGFNLGFGPLAPFDLTPAAFTVSAAILTWGLLRQHLLRLAPIAHRQVVAGLTDAVLVLDLFGHLVETNPAAERVLGRAAARVSRRPQTLPTELVDWARGQGPAFVRLDVADTRREYEVRASDLSDARGYARGRLLVLHDVTENRLHEQQLSTLLAERAHVADTLSRSLRPDVLPVIPGVDLAAAYRPAGGGHEIGGDFYDVYPADGEWSFAIGDVSGKGANAAAVTALARYTLRALTVSGRTPARTLAELNRHLLGSQPEDTYLTVAHGRFRAADDGISLVLSLGGHPRPLLVPAVGSIESIGQPGTAMGLVDAVSLHDTQLCLRPGDTLLLFTDGVTEARRGALFFGEERLIEVVTALTDRTAQAVADAVTGAVLDFQGQDAADDIALLVIHAPVA